MILLLFTTTYPYDAGAEQTFLSGEIDHLKKVFDRVVIVPSLCNGNRLPLPNGFEVDESYATTLLKDGLTGLLAAAFSSDLYRDILERPSILLHPGMLARLINFLGKAELTKQWVNHWMEQSGVPAGDCIFYTYWLDYFSMGIGLAKHNYPDIRLVSRAHGYDLYEERHAYSYWPCRRRSISLLDRLYLDSEAGQRYISERYPEHNSKYRTAFLGVQPAGLTSRQSTDNTFRIVSCSRIVPVKRVELILEGVAQAARKSANIRFEWHHFGNGDTREALQKRVNDIFPANASGYLPGYSTQSALLQFYGDNPVDVFINASVSEGTPVAVMEALSCGIPVIATAVGGNAEIVTSRNGLLLEPNPSVEETAVALLEFQADPEKARNKRLESLHVWKEKYNADSNFREFAQELLQVRNSGV